MNHYARSLLERDLGLLTEESQRLTQEIESGENRIQIKRIDRAKALSRIHQLKEVLAQSEDLGPAEKGET